MVNIIHNNKTILVVLAAVAVTLLTDIVLQANATEQQDALKNVPIPYDKSSIAIIGNATQLWNKTISIAEYAQAFPLDDIDGDNKSDVIMISRIYNGFNNTFTVSAVRGYDGVELWNKTFPRYADVAPAGDLNGDNKTDIIITSPNIRSGAPFYGAVSLFFWDEIPGKQNSNLIDFLEYNFGTNWLKSAMISKDDNGKTIRVSTGNNSLSLTLNDEKTKAYLKFGDGRIFEFLARTLDDGRLLIFFNNIYTITAVRGYDGIELWNKSSGMWMEATPSGDLNGDNEADVIMISTVSNNDSFNISSTIAAVRGYDGVELWNKSAQQGRYTWMQGTPPDGTASAITTPPDDLNGDNKADVILTSEKVNGTVTAVRGDDGVELWNKSSYHILWWANSVGDLNGDNKADVILISQSNLSNNYPYVITAVRGYDGIELWNKTFLGPTDIISVGDLNGDGKADSVIRCENYHGYYYTYSFTAVRGYDGAELWNKTFPTYTLVTPLGKVNGDNKADVIFTSGIYIGYQANIISAVRGYDGVELWNKTISGNSEVAPAGDLNNDLKGDALIQTNFSKISAINAADGSEFFSINSLEADSLLLSPSLFFYRGPNTWHGDNFSMKKYDLNGDGVNDVLVWSRNNLYAISVQTATIGVEKKIETKSDISYILIAPAGIVILTAILVLAIKNKK